MPKKKLYKCYICKDCEIDFIMSQFSRGGKPYCPQCAENLFVEKVKEIWMERHHNYKRPWTEEEDEILLVSVDQGYSNHDISIALEGRTEGAVRHRIGQLRKKMGIKGRKGERRKDRKV
jgi:DNA-binding NarL/FixJ family response regulator